MMRFGTKNLSESNIRNINKSLLTEGEVDLMKLPQVAAATKFFKAAWDKRVQKPSYILGQYYLKSDRETNFETAYRYMGSVVGFKLARFGTLVLPVPDLYMGGRWQFEGTGANGPIGFSQLMWDTSAITIEPNIKPADAAAWINEVFNQMPLKDIQALYNASPGKPKYDTYIAQLKTATTPIKPLLTGNAKAFFGV